MDLHDFIAVDEFCRHHGVKLSFINLMEEAGWIDIVVLHEVKFIHKEHLSDAEKLARLHVDLQINAEGVAVVMDLLGRVKKMKDEISVLRSRLKLYEANE